MIKIWKSVFLSLVVLSGMQAYAQRGGHTRFERQKKFVIEIDEHLQGQNKLMLKQLLKRAFPAIDINEIDFKKVMLTAKSKQGGGKAALIAGNFTSAAETIGGSPYEFERDAPRSYFDIQFMVPSNFNQGQLQIQLQGNIKVKKVVIFTGKEDQSLSLDLYDQQFVGQQTIRLKQLIKQQYPQLNVGRLELKSALVVGKSMQGHGEVSLVVGYDESMQETLEGNPAEFRSNALNTYDVVKLFNPSASSQGVFQLKTRGNIKIKTIEVDFE